MMDSQEYDLDINLADPKSIERQVPRIAAIVEEKRKEAESSQGVFETWRNLLDELRTLAGLILNFENPTPDSPPPSRSAQDAVVRIVEREARPIGPPGIAKGLTDEGHFIESPQAVRPALEAAANAGRLQKRGQMYASLGLSFPPHPQKALPMQAVPVPEAHLGLGGPPPQSKAEAAVRVLATAPNKFWTTPDISQVMISCGWMDDSDAERASLTSALSRLVSERKIFRPTRGNYQLAPPAGGHQE
jgi:hypothetical protein